MKHLRNYRKIARKVKDIVRRRCPEAEVYVFGSVVEGKATAASDIDILVICEGLSEEEKVKLKTEIWKELGFSVPIELHIASRKLFESWYKRFIKKLEKI